MRKFLFYLVDVQFYYLMFNIMVCKNTSIEWKRQNKLIDNLGKIFDEFNLN